MARPAIAVVGAGIAGCLAARELAARFPWATVTVLDSDGVGSGASRRSAGLHLPRGSTPRLRRMSAYSHDYYADLLRRHPVPLHPVAASVVTPAASGDPRGRGYLGLTKPELTEPELTESPPGGAVAVPDGWQRWRIAGCHYADVQQLAQVIAARLRPRVRFLEGVAVTGLARRGGRIVLSGGTGEQLTADAVVLAPGPWLACAGWRDLLAPLGLRVKKIVALHIERRPGPGDEVTVLDADDAFALPLAHRGHWLFSFASEDWDVDPDGLAGGMSAADLAAARDCLRRYSPALAAAPGCGRVFCDAYSPGREPVVRALDDSGQIVFAGAASGSGYRLGPAIAAEAADLLSTRLSEGATDDHQYV